MATLDVVNWKNKKVGSVDLDPAVFGLELDKGLLQIVVNWQLASRRRGTHNVKTRAFVRGGGKKPFKQKGTGNARQGSSRSPLMPGGAKLFGPSPRDYSYTLPKKVRKLGVRMALSYLSKEGKMTVLDKMEASGKTKELVQSLAGLGLKKALLVTGGEGELVSRAARNLPTVKCIQSGGINVFDLLKFDHLVVEQSALETVVQKVKAAQGAGEPKAAKTAKAAPKKAAAKKPAKKAAKKSGEA